MNFDYTPKVQALREKLLAFFDEHIYPNEQRVLRTRSRATAQTATRGCRPN